MPLFSVIIPTQNRRAFLPRTLESVFSQQHRGSEIIVVDDGSSDGTVEYLHSLGGRIQVLHQDHRGPGAARNAGAQSASGDYLAFIDSDDLWLPWTLATFAEMVTRYSRPALVCGKFVEFQADRELEDCRPEPASAQAFADYLASWPRHPIVGAGMIAVRRDAFLEVGGFATGLVNMEDHDLSLKLGTARGFVQIMSPVTMGWRKHPGGITNDLARSLAGCFMLIAAETERKYPGGSARARERRSVIASHARSVSLDSVKGRRVREAWRVYRATLWWHVSLRRLKYVFGFPVVALAAILRRSWWRIAP